MREKKELWVRCRESFMGMTTGYFYEKGTVYKGYKERGRYFIKTPKNTSHVEILEPGTDTTFEYVTFSENLDRILE